MFFILSKTAGFFSVPSNVAALLGLLGVILATIRPRAGMICACLGLVLLAVMGYSPLGNALMLPLEQRFPAWDCANGPPDGILVLGGAVSPDISAARHTAALNEAAERMTAAVELARRYPQARVLFSGGSGELFGDGGPETGPAARLFEALGLPRDRLLLEDRSRNTVENAVLSKQIAQPKPGEHWLLVTSAHHMPRAVGIFRKAGFPVEPYPTDWRTRGPADLWPGFPSLSEGLRRTDAATHEWIGLFVYWLTGKSTELFPGPLPQDTVKVGQDCRL